MYSKWLPIFSIFVTGTIEGQLDSQIAWSENSILPYLRAKTPVPPGRVDRVDDIILRFYNGTTTAEVVSLRLSEAKKILEQPSFNRTAPTVLYIHGYIELTTDESVVTVASAYLEAKPHYNVIVLDWSNMAYGEFISGAMKVKPVGLAAARQLIRLVAHPRGVPLEALHIVGHSLGSHIAGQIGRSMMKAGYQLTRISALDAALPGFYPPLLGLPVRTSDARFVDALHTDGGFYGTPVRTAHADFWPNGGYGKQPGCEPVTVIFTLEDFCSHFRSWRYWAESVRSPKAFPARKCPDDNTYNRGGCDDGQIGYMGHDAVPSLRGDFYLRTAAQSPFALRLQDQGV